MIGVAERRDEGGVAHDLGGLVEIAGIPLELHAEGVTKGVGRDPLGNGCKPHKTLQDIPDPKSAEPQVAAGFCRPILS